MPELTNLSEIQRYAKNLKKFVKSFESKINKKGQWWKTIGSPPFKKTVNDFVNIVVLVKKISSKDAKVEPSRTYVEEFGSICNSLLRRLNTVEDVFKNKSFNEIKESEWDLAKNMCTSLGPCLNQIKAYLKGSIIFEENEINVGAQYKCAIPEVEVWWNLNFGNKFIVKIPEFTEVLHKKSQLFKNRFKAPLKPSPLLATINCVDHTTYITKYEYDRFTILFRPYHLIGDVVYCLLEKPFGYCDDDTFESDFASYKVHTPGSYFLVTNTFYSFASWSLCLYDASKRWVKMELSPFTNPIDTINQLSTEIFKFPKGEHLSSMSTLTRTDVNIPELKIESINPTCEICNYQRSQYRMEPCVHTICQDCVAFLDSKGHYKCLCCNKAIISATKIKPKGALKKPDPGIIEKLFEDNTKTDITKKSTCSRPKSTPLALHTITARDKEMFKTAVLRLGSQKQNTSKSDQGLINAVNNYNINPTSEDKNSEIEAEDSKSKKVDASNEIKNL